jgi:hypothetical protein
MVHVYDPSYMGGSWYKDGGLRPATGKNARPYLKNNQKAKKGGVRG